MSMTSMKVSGYKKQLNAKIDEYRADIDKLKAQVSKTDGELQVRYANQVSDLESRLETLVEVKDRFAESTDAALADLEASAEEIKNDLKSALDRAKSAISS